MRKEMIKELNLLLKGFYDSVGSQKKLNGSETKRALMILAGECEKVASKYGFDSSLKDENASRTHDEVMFHYVRANRSPSEAKFNARMMATYYLNATLPRDKGEQQIQKQERLKRVSIMRKEMLKELDLLLIGFYDSIGSQEKLKGSETKRALMMLAGEYEKVASKYGFDLSLKDENALTTHNKVMLHYVRANRSPSEAKFNARMMGAEYLKATFPR